MDIVGQALSGRRHLRPRRILPDTGSFSGFLEIYLSKSMIYATNRSYNELCAPRFNDYRLYIGRYGEMPPVIKGRSHYLI